MDTQSLAPTLSNFNSQTFVDNSTQADVPAALSQASAAIRVAQRVVEAYEQLGDAQGLAYARNILQDWQAREAELQARLEVSRQALSGQPEKITLIRRVECNSCKAKLSPSATTCPNGCTGGLSISYYNPAFEGESLSRRQFLASLAGAAAVAATAALPALPAQATTVVTADEESPEDDNRTPFPDAARLAVIDAWSWKIDKALTALESYWTFVRHSRYAAPVDVDGSELLTLGDKAINAMSELVSLIEDQEYNDLVTAATGKEDIYWLFKRSIDERDWPREVMAAELEKPDFDQALAAELKAYLAENWPA